MRSFNYFYLGCLCFLIVLITPLSSAWAAPKSIMIYPLTIHAESSMEYVQKGLVDLMETTLFENGIAVTRAPEVLPKKDAISQAKNAPVDAVVIGSLTFLGDSISLNVSLIDSKTGENLVAYSKTEKDKGNLFNDINGFIDQITALTPAVFTPAVTKVVAEGSNTLSASIIRSEDIKTEIVALTVGDINKDGNKELAVADIHEITVLSFKNGSFKETDRIKCPSHLNIIHLDVWDADADGIDDIIVTAIHARRGNVQSSVYEWDGTKYALLCKNIDWFLKKGACPFSDKPVLLGQKQEIGGYFQGPIKAMTWDKTANTLIPDSLCNDSVKNINLYIYTTGDLHHRGDIETITYTGDDCLSLLKSSEEEVWSSSERFGGSLRYLMRDNHSPPDRYYLPPRLITGDFNKDGKIDVATLKNKNAAPRVFPNLKKFVEGQVVCLTFDTVDFKTLWTTASVPGYIADFIIEDLDNNGSLDLIYCVIPKKSSYFKKACSYVAVQTLSGPFR